MKRLTTQIGEHLYYEDITSQQEDMINAEIQDKLESIWKVLPLMYDETPEFASERIYEVLRNATPMPLSQTEKKLARDAWNNSDMVKKIPETKGWHYGPNTTGTPNDVQYKMYISLKPESPEDLAMFVSGKESGLLAFLMIKMRDYAQSQMGLKSPPVGIKFISFSGVANGETDTIVIHFNDLAYLRVVQYGMDAILEDRRFAKYVIGPPLREKLFLKKTLGVDIMKCDGRGRTLTETYLEARYILLAYKQGVIYDRDSLLAVINRYLAMPVEQKINFAQRHLCGKINHWSR